MSGSKKGKYILFGLLIKAAMIQGDKGSIEYKVDYIPRVKSEVETTYSDTTNLKKYFYYNESWKGE